MQILYALGVKVCQVRSYAPMRITFVLPTVNLSGGIRVVAIHARMLAARGHEVVLVSPPAKQPSLREKVKSLLKGNGWPCVEPNPKSHLDGAGLDHRVLDRWRPVTDADVPEADVVVATWWETAEWVAALSPGKGAKTYFVQGHEVFPHLPVARCHATYRLRLHKIVVARWLQDLMRSDYGDSVVDLVPNSVDHRQFHAEIRGKQPAPTVGLLYSTAPTKGLEVALEALRLVRERVPGLRVACFGSESPTEAQRLPSGATFQLSPPQEKIRELYSSCDVWLTASRREGFNLPALEAMACRTPVVSTRSGWPEEAIITGENGALVDVDDVEALARGVEWVLSRPESEWQSLSQRAYETSCSNSWEDSSRKFEEALLHACRRSRAGEIDGPRS